ncbi:MAG: hypothetical protein AAF624_19130 [Bacteroidota bacterium]
MRASHHPLAVLTLFALLLAVGCGGTRGASDADDPTVPPPNTATDTGAAFDIEVGESLTLNQYGDRIVFNRVVSDNRCPENVACVQAGKALISVTYVAEDVASTYTMEIPGGVRPTSREGTHLWVENRGYRFTFLGLGPYPGSEAPADMPKTATLKVEPVTLVRPGG